MRPDQPEPSPITRGGSRLDFPIWTTLAARRVRPLVTLMLLLLGQVPGAEAQIPPPQLGANRAPDLVARRASILSDEQARLAALPGLGQGAAPAPPVARDGATRFDPLRDVVPGVAASQAESFAAPAEQAVRREVAGQLFNLATQAAKTPVAPLALIDECLRAVLQRQPNHAEARRLLGFVPHEKTGWATPFATQQLKENKVKDPTFGWVPADWVAHLQRGELPALYPSTRWLAAADADALRRDWANGWTIRTEHFEIHANVPLSGVIAFGRHLEAFHQLFGSVMADLIGPEQLPLAQRLKNPKLQPTLANRPKHQVYYFATRAEYSQYLAPLLGGDARQSLGIYIPKKESPALGGKSYFFNDVGGQLDVVATLYHEVSHQLLFESAGADEYARNVGNYWVFEGLGTYFETLQTREDGSIEVGGLVGPRIEQARERLVAGGELVPLESFVAMGKAAFDGQKGDNVIYLHYAEAMALAVFLMQADGGRYREPFLDYARDAYKGQFRRRAGRTLEDRLDRSYPDLQRELLAYLTRPLTPPRRDVPAAP